MFRERKSLRNVSCQGAKQEQEIVNDEEVIKCIITTKDE